METHFNTEFQVFNEAPTGTLEITENGEHNVATYEKANVNIPLPDGYIKPNGTMEIAENGEYDVTDYENAKVNVPIPDGYILPEGSLAITESGEYDVTIYASANVDIPTPTGTIQITENGTHDVTDYASAEVMVSGEGVPVETYDKVKSTLDGLIDGSITEVGGDNKSIGNYTFYNCTSLTTANFPLVTSIGISAFNGCTKLTTANFPLVTSIDNYTFSSCTRITTVDFPLVTSIGSNAFYNCTRITTVVLRSETVCTLSNVNAFNGTPFASGKSGGVVYVPQNLIEQYQNATNWSTLYAQGTCTFLPIEGSEYE